jgi:hypothetical protein
MTDISTILEIRKLAFFKAEVLKYRKFIWEIKPKYMALISIRNANLLKKITFIIFIGSQSDRKFLRKVKTQIPPIDILIDDGGHTMKQQITAYEELFPLIKDNGTYLCEDLHTSILAGIWRRLQKAKLFY